MNINFNSSIPGYSYTLKSKEESSDVTSADKKDSAETKQLSSAEEKQVQELQARDAEVKAHEAAHQGGGGGAATYSYQQGPDGKMYAIGGEVSIQLKSGNTPEETIANAMQVIAAATAPSDPSAQDMSVAASARSMMIKAQQQKSQELQEQMQGYQTYKTQSEEETDSNSALNLSA